MLMKIMQAISLAIILLIATPTFRLQAQDPASECPPNSDFIWVERSTYGDGNSYRIRFEEGTTTYTDGQGNQVTVSNYVTGVLEQELGTSTELGDFWEDETVKAFAVAARTVGYASCGMQLPNGHFGIRDGSPQGYRPGHAAARADHYATVVVAVQGQYLTYNGNVFGVQYRTYVGPMTRNLQINGPHKGVADPVASIHDTVYKDENDNEINVGPQIGMGQHSADHWAVGTHNVDGRAAVSYDNAPRPAIPITQSAPNPQWESYLQILAHYYTNIQVVATNGNLFTPIHRWNPLQVDWNPTANAVSFTPPTMVSGVSYPVTIQLQNTGTSAFSPNTRLSCQWRKPDNSLVNCPDLEAANPDTLNVGASNTITLFVKPPANFTPGAYTLLLDMKIGPQFFHDWETGRPWF